VTEVAKNKEDDLHWSTLKEAGTVRGIMFLLFVHRVFGRMIFSVILYPVMAYFFLFMPLARRSSYEYLQNHYAAFPNCWARRPGYAQVYWHLYAFGQALLDKLLAWTAAIDESEFELADKEKVEALLEKSTGQLIIGSHIGNLEYCRGFMQRNKKRSINILVYDRHSANFIEAMQTLNSESRVNVYQVDSLDIPTILNLKTKIESGEWLFIAGDRIPLSGEQRTVQIEFLGKSAPLPIGPYMLAKVLQCEVQLMFSYRKKEKVFFELVNFAEKVVLPRKGSDEALQQYAQNFANEMERQLVACPYQWFNFFPYWSAEEVSSPKEALS